MELAAGKRRAVRLRLAGGGAFPDPDRARVLFDTGTNRQAFFLGHVDKYSWKDTGSSFGLSDTLAAQLWGQLQMREQILAKRRAVWERYAELVAPLAAATEPFRAGKKTGTVGVSANLGIVTASAEATEEVVEIRRHREAVRRPAGAPARRSRSGRGP